MGELVHTLLRSREGVAIGGFGSTQQARDIPPLGQAGFIDELYAAAVDFPHIAPALASFAAIFGADLAWLVGDGEGDGISIIERSADETVPALVEAELLASLATAFGKHATEVHAGKLSRGLRGDAVYYVAVVPEGQEGNRLGVAAVRRHAPFTEADQGNARALVPDMRRALRLRNRALEVDGFAVGRQMFENNPIAIFVTRNRGVDNKNGAAAAVLASRKPVAVAAGKLRFEDSRAQAAFELLSRADGAQVRQAYAFVVEGGEGRTWIAQLSLANFPSAQHAAPPRVVVALTPFSGASQTRETMLEGFTELTPTERAIFAAFVDGNDIASIAEKMQRSVETVRWHVRNLFTKLGVNSQADLARLGALLLPI